MQTDNAMIIVWDTSRPLIPARMFILFVENVDRSDM